MMKASGSSAGQLPWTPAQITTALWLDASDVATITTISGAVSEWRDKSGNARHATQGNAAFRPVNTANTINLLPVVTFDGVNDFMDVVSTFLQGQTQINLFYVFSRYGAGTGDTYKPEVTPLVSNSTNQGSFHYVKNSNDLAASYPLTTIGGWSAYDLSSGTAYSTNAPELIGFNVLSGTWRVYRNGTQEGSDGSVGSAPTPIIIGLRLAQQQTPLRTSNIGIGELLVAFNSTDAQREIIEGYFAHKWGTAANLPSGHPYKNAAPTVQL
jgi:hypothetical protein